MTNFSWLAEEERTKTRQRVGSELIKKQREHLDKIKVEKQ